MENITRKQLFDVLNLINDITDGEIYYGVKSQLTSQVAIHYFDHYGDECATTIIIGPDNIVENPKISALKNDISRAEERLADLKKELAELTQE